MATASYTDRDVTVEGLKLHYQEWGEPSSPAILMLHGFGVDGHMFDEFAGRMQDRFRLIALHQRGHGDSDWAQDGDYSRDAFCNDVNAFRLALGLDRFVLMGHSMGGMNAVTYTVAHPEPVRALVLVDVGPEAAREGVENIMRFTQGPDDLEFEEFVQMAHHFNPHRSIDNIRERMRHRLKPTENGKWTWKFDKRFRQKDSGIRVGSESTNEQMWDLYRAVKPPTLLIRGGRSDVLTQEVADRAQREMQRARVVLVPDAGHSVPGDNPAGFTSVVETFLEDLDRGAFEPEVEVSLPPLAELVTENDRAAARRGPSTKTLLLVGAGVAIAVAGIMLARPKKQAKEPEARKVKGAAPVSGHSPASVVANLADVAAANLVLAQQLAAAAVPAIPSPSAIAAKAKRAKGRNRGRAIGTAIVVWKVASFAPKLALGLRASKPVPPPKKSKGLLPWRG
ncbi:MAG: alpha/beta fold hydrolase [Dehalococcoidia bacterium]